MEKEVAEITRADTSYYLSRDKLFAYLPKDTNSIFFLGSSLTQNFELVEFLKDPHIKNRGINGDKSTTLLNRLSSIIEGQPKKIFIEIGINDLGLGQTVDNLVYTYKKIIDTLITKCVKTRIYIQSLFPVADESDMLPNYCSPEMNFKICKVNDFLKQYSIHKKITYIDIHDELRLGKELNPEFSLDGVHLTPEGYKVWANVVKKYL